MAARTSVAEAARGAGVTRWRGGPRGARAAVAMRKRGRLPGARQRPTGSRPGAVRQRRTAWSMPAATCHKPHSASTEITNASTAGQCSGGDTRDASHISVTAAISRAISMIADAGSQPATPEATQGRSGGASDQPRIRALRGPPPGPHRQSENDSRDQDGGERKGLDGTPDTPPGKDQEGPLSDGIAPSFDGPGRPFRRLHRPGRTHAEKSQRSTRRSRKLVRNAV